MIGLKRGTVVLCEHDPEWEVEAAATIDRLREILGECAVDIQHIGSTAIKSIKAKPIIDIAVACESFATVMGKRDAMQAAGFYYREKSSNEGQILFACGSHYDHSDDKEMQTHFIHVVLADSDEWRNYIVFRDYLNENEDAAREYERLKEELSLLAAEDGNRSRYIEGKNELVAKVVQHAGRAAKSHLAVGRLRNRS